MLDKDKVGIINTGTSNLYSVQLACKEVGIESIIINEAEGANEFGGLILPGVGAFEQVMLDLKNKGLDKYIIKFIKTGKPVFGICLGFQLLFNYSEEFGIHKGLGVFNGKVKKIPKSTDAKKEKVRKVPFIGWSRINKCNDENLSSWTKKPLSLLPRNAAMYFVHSYYADVDDKEITSSYTNYSDFKCCSSITFKNVFASQFHPEKSGKLGLSIFSNFKNQISL